MLESEKEQGYYWAFDTKELTRGSLKERYDAYEIAVRNNILQVDEIRREEDYEPLGFNFIKLGLQDVLLNPETLEVFTPNTGQTKNLITGEVRADGMELRYNPYHDDRGRFTSGGSGGGYGKKAKKAIDKSAKNDTIEKRPKSQRMGKKETEIVSSAILTDHPNYDNSKIYDYEHGNHFYQFFVKSKGNYKFTYKLKLEGNQDIINKIRGGKL